jgi:hypothetical protein
VAPVAIKSKQDPITGMAAHGKGNVIKSIGTYKLSKAICTFIKEKIICTHKYFILQDFFLKLNSNKLVSH